MAKYNSRYWYLIVFHCTCIYKMVSKFSLQLNSNKLVPVDPMKSKCASSKHKF